MIQKKAINTLRHEVSLLSIRHFAYHGFYPEEQLVGHEFFVDVNVYFDLPVEEIPADQNDMKHTVNYEVLNKLIKEEMEMPRKLLETVCYDIFDRIRLNFSFLNEINVRIRKSNPPFGGDASTAAVGVSWKRPEN